MKLHGDRKRQSSSHHSDKYPAKHSGSSKSRYSQSYRDKRSDVSERSHRANDEASPSQHLWIGNVSTSVNKTMLAEQFSRFGDVEIVKLFSMKNYAFVTLKTVEDAVYAKKGLHGAILGGLAIRIEFAKGVNYPVDEKITPEKEKESEERITSLEKGRKDGVAASQEKKPVHTKVANSEERSKQSPEISKGNRNCDSSEVLWIGFPLHLKIDEKKLHKLFAPFGGVEKITTFPGRTYAFVRFQNVKAAARAKDALQGKLFNDPRVSISFAKSEVGPVDHYQGTSEMHPSSPLKSQVGTRAVSSRNKEEGADMFPSSSSVKLEAESSNFSLPSPRKDEALPTTASPANFSTLTSSRDEKKIGMDSQWSASSFFTSRSGRGINEQPYSPPNPGVHPKLSPDAKGDFSENVGFKHGLKAETEKGMLMFPKDNFLDRMDIKSEERWMLQEDYGNKREQKRGRLDIDPSSGALSSSGSSNDKSRIQVEDGEAKRQRLGDQHFWGDTLHNIGADPDHTDQRTYFPSHETWDDQKSQNKSLLGRTPPPTNNEEITLPLGSEENWDNKEGSRQNLLGRVPVPLPDSNLDQLPVMYKNEHGLVESPISPPPPDIESPVCPPPKDVFRWEGTIAKGGMEVCRCRCFPATKEINVIFPEILNCTARTSLDMLAKYISQVIEFSVVLFMPQGVPDVAPYQELMGFLADKQRAAVCKLSEENTLFLVPPSDFVEQFLNVPKSNNILGVVLSQHQQHSQPSQILTEQQLSFPKPPLLVDDLKKQNLQRLEVYASTDVTSMVIPTQPSTAMMTPQPSTSQSIIYQVSQVEGSNSDTPVPAFQNFFAKSLVGHDKSQDHDVAADNGSMLYQTQGSKSLPVDYHVHENNPVPDLPSLPFQIPGNNSMLHAPHMFGSSSLSLGSKLLPHQDSGVPSRPQMFFPPHITTTSEQLSLSCSNQMTAESQKSFSTFPFHEQPWLAPVARPQSAPSTQLNTPVAHLQQSLTYGPTHLQQQFPLFDGGLQDGQVQSSNFSFKSGASNSRNMLLPYPPIPEPGIRPPGPPPGPPPESGLRPPGPPQGLLPASLFQVHDKPGVETEQQQALQMALAGIQDQEGSDEDQKKFRATVELAAALLQQLQQQTKM